MVVEEAELGECRQLKKHTGYDAVIKEFGQPDAVVGSGFVIVEYHFQDGTRMRLNFGGRGTLLALSEISKDGAQKHIIKMDDK